MSDRTVIETIKGRLDIVSVIQEYVPNLKHSGRNFFGLCPFHTEKSPSFSVNQELQIYKCFGCGESGDVITFIEKVEGVEFPMALEIAAKKAGVELPKNKNGDLSKKDSEREEIIKANTLTTEYFHYLLTTHLLGKRGKEYAHTRKLNDDVIKKFKIGYAPQGYNNLKKFLTSKKFNEKDLVKWSLLVEKNGRIYDKFRDRLMFPIHNHLGEAIGFSGRVIDNDDIPKYLNSSETAAYRKSSVVYGLFQGKETIRKSRSVIMVEGNVDVPTAHQFGIANIVAPMGTALTEDQLKLIKRYAETIYFAFDSDSAGEKALMRGFEMAENLGITTKAIDLHGYKDLDEFINSEPKNVKEAIEKAEPVIESLINRIGRHTDLDSSIEIKLNLVKKIAPFIRIIKDEIKRKHYIGLLSAWTQTDENTIIESIKNANVQTTPDRVNENPIKTVAKKPLPKTKDSKSEYIVAMLMQHEFLRKNNIDFEIFENGGMLEYIYNVYINSTDANKAINSLEENEQEVLEKLLMINIGKFESENQIQHFFDQIYKKTTYQFYRAQINIVRQKIAQRETAGEDYTDLLKEYDKFSSKLK